MPGVRSEEDEDQFKKEQQKREEFKEQKRELQDAISALEAEKLLWTYDKKMDIYNDVIRMTHNQKVAQKVTGIIIEAMSQAEWKSLSDIEQAGRIGMCLLLLDETNPALLDESTQYKLGNLHGIVQEILTQFKKNVQDQMQLTITEVTNINYEPLQKLQSGKMLRDDFMNTLEKQIQEKAMSHDDIKLFGLHRFRERAQEQLEKKIEARNNTIEEINANRSKDEKRAEQLSYVTDHEKKLALQTLNQTMHRLSLWFQREVMIKFLDWVSKQETLKKTIFKAHWFSRQALQAARKNYAAGTYHLQKSMINQGLWEIAAWERAMRSIEEEDMQDPTKEKVEFWSSPYNPYLVRFQLASI
jgi:hypothetical protein